jgi:GR25 family glycosyltransferase involved in LPS biosynthesis
MLDLDSVEKYVINLKSRTDRLEHIKNEFKYIDWDFNLFEAIDTGSYEGCAFSHVKIAEIAKNKGLDYVMVFEDDCFFMPYAKDLLRDCLKDLDSLDWDLFHLAPSIHRPLTYEGGNLVNLSGPHPPKQENHRGIYGLSAYIYRQSLCDEILKWGNNRDGDLWTNPALQKPIDALFDEYIYPNFKCYCPRAPIVTQIMDYSTINNGVWNNHYIMTYNWLSYINDKDMPSTFNMDQQRCLDFRNESN